MIEWLKLENFKNFSEAKLFCGPVTLLMGINAAGKSNLRDAFRLLLGIGLGYNLAEIFGRRYTSGQLQWSGIRGGLSEVTYFGSTTFSLTIKFKLRSSYQYKIEIAPKLSTRPQVVAESLYCDQKMLFDTRPNQDASPQIEINIARDERCQKEHTLAVNTAQPVLTQILEESSFSERTDSAAKEVRRGVQATLTTFRALCFFDLIPNSMREPSFLGQNLGDRGENLSSVLADICKNPTQKARKEALVAWVKALTPMDVQDFEFTEDQMGRVLVTLVESAGRKTSAYSASDGTLRFLAIAAALLNPHIKSCFFEELENGIHPTRLHLLLDLIEQTTLHNDTQVIATTHSPQLLRLISPATLDYTSLIYRLPDESTGHIQRLVDLPQPALDILRKKNLAQLYESGWFENVVNLLSEEKRSS
ncbi:MAG: AAA family ATPase [Chloroflexota bacterium]|nr:AAA family ATPase [Chloroflexota bacterium]